MIFDRYNIIKTIETNEDSSIYIAEEREKKVKFLLKRISSDNIDYSSGNIEKAFQEAKKELTETGRDIKVPSIVNIFTEYNHTYFLIDYDEEKTLQSIISYPATGKLLNNRYVIICGISGGGFGKVYIGKDLSLPGKYWAIKEMLEQTGDPEIIEKSFRTEAEILSRLTHPSIPGISDFFIDGHKLYLVMDYINGTTLKKLIDNLKTGEFFSEEKVISWALHICDVLNYLHNRTNPVIFRDLKPDNIMLTEEGDIKLIDFGIARLFQSSNETTQYALLTEGYAPQEQWLGRAEQGSDIYALGATIFHLLTKVHPKNLSQDFPPLTDINPSVSPGLGKIVVKALEIEIEKRYPSIKEMKIDLLNLHSEKERKEKSKFHFIKGKDYEKKRDFLSANFEYMRSLEFFGDNPQVLSSIGDCLKNMGLNDKAAEHYNKVLNMNIPDELKKEIKYKTDNLNKPVYPAKDDKELKEFRKELWREILLGSGFVTLPLMTMVMILLTVTILGSISNRPVTLSNNTSDYFLTGNKISGLKEKEKFTEEPNNFQVISITHDIFITETGKRLDINYILCKDRQNLKEIYDKDFSETGHQVLYKDNIIIEIKEPDGDTEGFKKEAIKYFQEKGFEL